MSLVSRYSLGSTLHDHTHKGTGQAGNKSLLSYRSDNGVPGYTGFISGEHAIEVPTKGSTKHTGRVLDRATRARAVLEYQRPRNSHYADDYDRHLLKDRPVRDRTLPREGGYWIRDRHTMGGGQRKRFIATSTYKTEVENSSATARMAFEATADLRPTLAGFVAARTTSTSKAKGAKAKGEPEPSFGYRTTYTSMVLKDPKTGRLAASGRERSAPAKVEKREARLHRTVVPKFEGLSVYSNVHGTYGSDPLVNSAPSEKDISRMASTAEFQAGTTRATHRIPGYQGYIPSSTYNDRAIGQAEGLNARKSAKAQMLLYSLDQYPRDVLPQYGGFRAQAGRNIQEPQPPNQLTTQGQANIDGTKGAKEDVDTQHFRDSDSGTMSFFTGGSVNVSDNGRSNAEQYYHTQRPKEGLPRIYYPSLTTSAGYKFPHK